MSWMGVRVKQHEYRCISPCCVYEYKILEYHYVILHDYDFHNATSTSTNPPQVAYYITGNYNTEDEYVLTVEICGAC